MPLLNTLEYYRKQRGLTQRELAKALAVNRLTVWRWENGRCEIPHEQLLRLAAILQVAGSTIVPSMGTVPPALCDDNTQGAIALVRRGIRPFTEGESSA